VYLETSGWYYYILKTIDGGTTWFGVSKGPEELFFSFFFTDASTGYAVGTSIIKTTDGGMTWNTVLNLLSDQLKSVFFTDANTGYAVGSSGTIIKTIDAGLTWDAQSIGATLYLNTVYFTDANTGYAVGSSGTIIKTIDAGLTWDAQSSGTTSWLNSIYFPTFDTGYIVGDNGTILKTTNGGGYPVGLNDQQQTANTLTIYPNPASTTITIETPSKWSLSILNFTGQQLLQQGITESTTTLDVSGLPSGIYVVKLAGEKGMQVGKFIKH
jgi:photosystem II stability/assembly factor-like uncharacterized protein